MGYLKKAIAGFSWQTLLKIIASLVTLAKISILARLLTPNDFGLFSLALIALGLSESFTQTGVNITILQSKRSMSYFIDTAWVVAIIRGFIIAIIMNLLGFGLSHFYHNPQLIYLVTLTSFIPVVKGFINPAIVLFQKKLEFFKGSLFSLIIRLAEAALAVALGFWLKSVEALILGMLGAAFAEVLLSFLYFELKPRFRYYASRGQEILRAAKWLSLSSLAGYLNDNLDDLIVGKLTSTPQLGIYHNAYSLGHKANYDLARSLHYGTLPIYTRMLDDQARLKRAFFKTLSWSLGLFSLVSAVLLIFPQPAVELILGDQWLEAIPLLPWLTAAGLIHAGSYLVYTLFLAKASYKLLNFHQILNLILMVGLMILLGQQQGLLGTVKGLFFGRLLALPVVIYGIFQATHH